MNMVKIDKQSFEDCLSFLLHGMVFCDIMCNNYLFLLEKRKEEVL